MSQEETDYTWLELILRQVRFDGYNRGKLQRETPRVYTLRNERFLKSKYLDIKDHFTAQAKQHQMELIRARIDTIDDALTYHIGQGVDPSDRNWNLMQYYLPRKKDLPQAELDKLENKQ